MTIAIGFFDGVHLGHQAILAGADVALTFENHPLSFLAPERAPRLIMSREERVRAIQNLGVHVTALDFDAETANLSPEDFLCRLRSFITGWSERLKIPVEPLSIRAGANWHFGKGGAGDVDWLRAHCIHVTVVPYAPFKDEPISSTRIRAALEEGRIEEATAMLGHPYEIAGERFSGKGEGRALGYPTINLRPRFLALHLPLGVYEVEVAHTRALANYGLAPTFGDRAWQQPVFEIHFLSPSTFTSPTLSTFAFSLIRFIRPERTFSSPEALRRQIAADIAAM